MAFLETYEEHPEEERKPLPLRRIIMIAGGVFGVIVLIGAVIWGPTLWQVVRQGNPELTIPPKAAGLTLDTSERGQRTAEGMREALSVPVGFDKTVGGVYQDPAAANRSAIVVAGTATLFDPEGTLDDLFSVITDTAGGVTGTHAVDAGPLGGEARCGVTTIDADRVPVCGWADHGSAGLMLFPGHTPEESAPKFVALRGAIQKR
ncbi:hypothetical protein Lfu02_53350 [Longispora fulva]|uniref:Uncharacterized protein n=1 Tax=Longispora fulva TaxID=619741 RepID=A0A8J7H3U2_9ACTN|nr:hypothetical protein [Longispora fulva]MBG6140773.1 hypothetical protein [Longispora fulva]GIG60963.1 hypothetical protein Lfu02_53350 [Longispora fulva]